MDFCLPGEEKWTRTDYENAREELRDQPNTNYRQFSSSSASDVTEGPKSRGNWSAPDTQETKEPGAKDLPEDNNRRWRTPRRGDGGEEQGEGEEMEADTVSYTHLTLPTILLV